MDYIIIGTAGHVDHGQTALIKRLTGIDIERKEEKERGMTIDLGFAYFKLASNKIAGVIDVPGHEKFLKNMLAGIGGIELVLFVVAADEGVMPQTKEHLDIMNLLGIQTGIIVVTKADIVDEELLELAIEDVKDAVKGTFLENAPVVVTSVVTDKGIDELTGLIDNVAKDVKQRDFDTPARLPVDRVFTKPGFGTIITGTLLSGKIKEGDTLELLPVNFKTRVRNIQVHNIKQPCAFAGQRTALNLVGIDTALIERGALLATPNTYELTDTIEARVTILPDVKNKITHNIRVVVYINTSEVFARILILDKREMDKGEEAYVRLKLETPVVADFDDRFVLRLYSPRVTIGGGIILSPHTLVRRQKRLETISMLQLYENNDLDSLLYEILKNNGCNSLKKSELKKKIPLNYLLPLLDKFLEQGKIIHFPKDDSFVLKEVYQKECNKITDIIQDFHNEYKWKIGLTHSELSSKYKSVFFDDILNFLKEQKIIEITDKFIKLSKHSPVFTLEQENLYKKLQSIFNQNDFITKAEVIEILKN